MRIVNVHVRDRAYPIFIGGGARSQLPGVISDLGGVTHVAFIADQHVADLHLERVLGPSETKPAVMSFPPGERSKSIAQVERLYDGLAEARIARQDLIVTFGGGVAGDLGGFAAATWMRGTRFLQLPTTLLAGIDASIGGKTGVNHASGKNLIGSFHQPVAVIVDTDFLDTLPQRDLVAGLAESIKHAAIRDADLLAWHEEHVAEIVGRSPAVLEELIARSCEIKAEVVARDEREDDLRMILNHGHTIGHAIEHLLEYELRHGECVALGMLVENELARRRGLLDDGSAGRIAALIERCQLPTRLPHPLDPGEVAAVCRMDKKVRAGAVNFVLIREPGETERVADISPSEIAGALGAVQPT